MISNAIVWDVNPMLIDSFVKVRWYGLMFAIGFLVGYKIVDRMFKRREFRLIGLTSCYYGS